MFLLFFAGQRIRSKRKAALKFGLRLSSFTQLPEAVIKTRFAQTVYALLPQSTASLGCILKGDKTILHRFFHIGLPEKNGMKLFGLYNISLSAKMAGYLLRLI